MTGSVSVTVYFMHVRWIKPRSQTEIIQAGEYYRTPSHFEYFSVLKYVRALAYNHRRPLKWSSDPFVKKLLSVAVLKNKFMESQLSVRRGLKSRKD